MSTTNYRILFEIIVLHDYYLSQPDESSFFALTSEDKQAFLQKQLELDHYNVSKDLSFTPTVPTTQMLRNHRIRFIPTNTGFFLGAEVDVRRNEVGDEIYNLKVPITEPVRWQFVVGYRNTQYMNFTNQRFKTIFPAKYLFSNKNNAGIKEFPSLASSLPNFTEGSNYEMGELVFVDDKINQALFKTSESTVGWVELGADHHWISESDRVLLPLQFSFQISEPGVTSAVFTLKDILGEEINTIDTNDLSTRKTTSFNNELRTVLLDFRNTTKEIQPGEYQLEVSVNGSTPKVYALHLNDDLYTGNGLGGVGIISKSAGTGWDILNDDSQLLYQADQHPIFEIRLKNRSTYWRYRSQTKQSLKAENEALNFLEAVGKDLRTKTPKSLQRLTLQFENGGGKTFLPNPAQLTIKPENDGRMYTDVFVSEVKDLIGIK